MFVSFFPAPRALFWSAAIWTLVAVLVWFFLVRDMGSMIGLENPPEGTPPIIGVTAFVSKPFIWFYIYYAMVAGIFVAIWSRLAPHPWFGWSVPGSALIVFATYFQVEVSVAINRWFGPFYDLIQAALSKTRAVTLEEFYGELLSFAGIAFAAVVVGVLTRFFVSHFNFRWRMAMNDYYMSHWRKLRSIEGASQRVQDDTMRFSSTMEGLGVNFIDSVMTLIAFLPVLHGLEASVTGLPLIGQIPYPLVSAAIFWSIFGTTLMALIGIKLPGLEFRNQRVEASYRKELVYGEDHEDRAQPETVTELFLNLRKNYFRLYFNYMYFNVGRIVYLQADGIFPYFILGPTIVAAKITLGPMQQIIRAFGEVRSSFQFLVNSWTTIVSLISIYKRLRAFEAAIHDKPLPQIDQDYLAGISPGMVGDERLELPTSSV